MSEKFDPKDFASFEKLPEEKKTEFKPVEGGFARKEAVENFELAEKTATIIKNIAGEDLKATDVLLNQFTEEEEEREREQIDKVKEMIDNEKIKHGDVISITTNEGLEKHAIYIEMKDGDVCYKELIGDRYGAVNVMLGMSAKGIRIIKKG